MRIKLLISLLGFLYFIPALGQTDSEICRTDSKCGPINMDPCQTLTPQKRQIAQEILKSTYLYTCCDLTISECLKEKPVCPSAIRVANNVCQRVKKGEDKKTIVRAITNRAKSLTGSLQYQIRSAAIYRIGNPKAPITLTAYICATCLYCARIIPWLYQQVMNGPLKGRVKILFRFFPIKGHAYSAEGGLALIAAAQLGQFYPYLARLYQKSKLSHDYNKLKNLAGLLQLDSVKWQALYHSPATRQFLIESKKEGIRNGVEATPTFFINNRRYYAELTLESLRDILLEADELETKKTN